MSKQGFVECVARATADGPTLTAAAAATCLPVTAKYTFTPNQIQVGTVVRLTMTGRISSVITTPGTARYDVRYGGSVIFDSLAILLDTVAGHTTVGWKLVVEMTCRTEGASAVMFGQGTWTSEDILGVPATAPKGVLTAMLPWNTAPVVGGTFDATAAGAFDVFFTQTAATGSMTVHTCELEVMN